MSGADWYAVAFYALVLPYWLGVVIAVACAWRADCQREARSRHRMAHRLGALRAGITAPEPLTTVLNELDRAAGVAKPNRGR